MRKWVDQFSEIPTQGRTSDHENLQKKYSVKIYKIINQRIEKKNI